MLWCSFLGAGIWSDVIMIPSKWLRFPTHRQFLWVRSVPFLVAKSQDTISGTYVPSWHVGERYLGRLDGRLMGLQPLLVVGRLVVACHSFIQFIQASIHLSEVFCHNFLRLDGRCRNMVVGCRCWWWCWVSSNANSRINFNLVANLHPKC